MAEVEKCSLQSKIQEYSCQQCDYKNKNSSYLWWHIEAVHFKDDIQLKCNYCEIKVTTKFNLQRHISVAHKAQFNLERQMQIFQEAYQNINGNQDPSEPCGVKNKFPCQLCKKSFNRKDHLASHVKSHDTQTEYPCDTCEYKALSKHHLKRHVLSVHQGETFSCDYCEVKMRRKDFIKRHVQSVHFGFKFKCEKCKEEFKRQDILRLHIKFVHEGEKCATIGNCEKCNKSFKRKEHLQRHIKRCKIKASETKGQSNKSKESGIKPKCDDDLKKPKEVSAKDKDILVQSNVEKFACNFCDYETLQDKSIKRHLTKNHTEKKMTLLNPTKEANVNELKIQTKEFKHCSICEFKSQRVRNLKRHIETLHGIRKFKCDFCELEFSRKDYIARHVSSVHEGEVFRCEHCGASLKRKDHLKKHILSVHYANNSCNFCDFKAMNRVSMRKHVFSKHEDKLFHKKV